jgi:hypothetical protein
LPLQRAIRVVRGTTRTFTVVCTLDGVAVDLTGTTVTLTVKTAPTADGDEVYSLDVTSHSDPSNGETELTIPASADFGTDGEISTYVYEIRMIDGSTEIVFFAGPFEVYPTGAPL